MPKPFQLNTDSSAKPVFTRDTIGRFARPDALPVTPLAEEKPAKNDQQIMSGWAPGIGQNSAAIRQQENPYEPIAENASVREGGFNVK